MKLIHSVVSEYIREKSTIVLAVISAKDNDANQAILNTCREVDKDGHRILGIVTNSDYLKPGSGNEKTWIALTQNSDICLELGWHMLKNRSEDEMDTSFQGRSETETDFFNCGQYLQIPEQDREIDTLRTKLSKQPFQYLKRTLPKLHSEVNAKHHETIKQLEALTSQSCSTLSEQKRFLMSITTSYQAVDTSAADGHYEHPFFGPVDIVKKVDKADTIRSLRALVQQLDQQYASQMRQFGHKYVFWATDEHAGTNSADDFPDLDLKEEHTQDKVKYFIADVMEQIIERYLLYDLAEETLSLLIVTT